jgi:hypothetical protein
VVARTDKRDVLARTRLPSAGEDLALERERYLCQSLALNGWPADR